MITKKVRNVLILSVNVKESSPHSTKPPPHFSASWGFCFLAMILSILIFSVIYAIINE